MAALLLMLAACVGGPGGESGAPVTLRSPQEVAADIGDDPAFASLDAEARMLVRDVLAHRPLVDLCRDGGRRLPGEVRRVVLDAMAAERIRHPRRAGTEAGRYLDRRCRQAEAGNDILRTS
ncbi:MAG: hypothetical protein D6757_00710 [Alphaproteobacteria bacterium]|nr:MAG: hypothetical protein D6757_00710 [Alphaproteobacteria bacterium]